MLIVNLNIKDTENNSRKLKTPFIMAAGGTIGILGGPIGIAVGTGVGFVIGKIRNAIIKKSDK